MEEFGAYGLVALRSVVLYLVVSAGLTFWSLYRERSACPEGENEAASALASHRTLAFGIPAFAALMGWLS